MSKIKKENLHEAGYTPRKYSIVYACLLGILLIVPVIVFILAQRLNEDNTFLWVGNSFGVIALLSFSSNRFAEPFFIDKLLMATRVFLGKGQESLYNEFDKCFKYVRFTYYLDYDRLQHICRKQNPRLLAVKAAMENFRQISMIQTSLSFFYAIILLFICMYLRSK